MRVDQVDQIKYVPGSVTTISNRLQLREKHDEARQDAHQPRRITMSIIHLPAAVDHTSGKKNIAPPRFPYFFGHMAFLKYLHPDQADFDRAGAEGRHSTGDGTNKNTREHKLRAVHAGNLWAPARGQGKEDKRKKELKASNVDTPPGGSYLQPTCICTPDKVFNTNYYTTPPTKRRKIQVLVRTSSLFPCRSPSPVNTAACNSWSVCFTHGRGRAA